MQIDDQQNLPPETLELLNRIAGRPGAESTPMDEVMLAAFACGVSTAEQEGEMVSSLVRNRELRTRLKAMEAELQTIRETPFGQIAECGVNPILVHCMRGAMQASLRVLCRAKRISKDRGWTEVRRARDLEAKTVRAMIGAVGHTIQMSMVRHAKREDVRDRPILGPGIPSGLSARVVAQIRQDGSLIVSPTYAENTPGAITEAGSVRIAVELADPNGGSVHLGEHHPLSKAPVEAEGFTEISGIEVGYLPGRLFRLDIGDHPSESTDDSGLFANVRGSSRLALFDLVEPVRIEREQLIVTLRAPDDWRELGALNLELKVPAGNLIQLAGRWPMADWDAQVRTIRCPLTGVIDGSVECGSVLRLSLVRA